MRPDLPIITPEDHHLKGIKNLYLATELGQLDVLGELPDVCTYAELAARSVEVDFDGLKCRLIDLDTLIAAKRRLQSVDGALPAYREGENCVRK